MLKESIMYIGKQGEHMPTIFAKPLSTSSVIYTSLLHTIFESHYLVYTYTTV